MEGIINKILLYNIENSIQYPMINHNGKDYLLKRVYIGQCSLYHHKLEFLKYWILMGGVPVAEQQKRIRLGNMRFRVRSLASLTGLRIQHCCELWCRSWIQLGSGVDVAVV